jgi:3-oxoisoapionate decarboxylase
MAAFGPPWYGLGVNYAVTAYGLPHALGLLKTKDGSLPKKPVTVFDLMDWARLRGLSGVDIPLPDDLSAEAIRDALAERDLRLIAECMALLSQSAEENLQAIRKANAAGAKVVRFCLSGVLEGKRGQLPGGWLAHREALVHRMREVLPVAEELGVSLAFENHQDADTSDFLYLYEKSGESSSFGVCLDTGNPLAVGEDPVETARTLAPLIRHVHLKDYTVHFAPEGYRLVRCVAGEGVVDFPEILKIVRNNGFTDLLPGIEIAAQATRTIPMLDPTWWTEFPPRDARTLLGPLGILWKQGIAKETPYSSAWERGEGSEAVIAEEWDVLEKSAVYFTER